VARGAWVDPRAGQVTLADYSRQWLAARTDLRPRSRELSTSLLRLHIRPALGSLRIARVTPSTVRSWFAELSGDDGPGQATAARSYRLLRTIMNTAVTDELLIKNPCQVTGAGVERSPERPIATVPEVQALADAFGPRSRPAVLLASFCSLRRGEILALRRGDVALLLCKVTVRRAVVNLATGELFIGEPRTAAGRRTIAVPPVIIPALEEYLAEYVVVSPDSPLFTGEKGGPLRPHVLQVAWDNARKKTGLQGFHFHDLCHSGNTWAATTGASTAELMARMGHASAAAALRYQHATADRDRAIATALSSMGERSLAPVTEIGIGERRSS